MKFYVDVEQLFGWKNKIKKCIYLTIGSIILMAVLLISTAPAQAAGAPIANPFYDVKPKDWHYMYDLTAYKRDLMSGTSQEYFKPQVSMTREMFVTVLAKFEVVNLDLYYRIDTGFVDVPRNEWYSPYVAWAKEKGITHGIGNGKFGLGQKITREEMAVLLNNFTKQFGYTLPNKNSQKSFIDKAQISEWAIDSINTMQKAGILNGNDKGAFEPKKPSTRAETATMICLYYDAVKNIKGTDYKFTPPEKGSTLSYTGSTVHLQKMWEKWPTPYCKIFYDLIKNNVDNSGYIFPTQEDLDIALYYYRVLTGDTRVFNRNGRHYSEVWIWANDDNVAYTTGTKGCLKDIKAAYNALVNKCGITNGMSTRTAYKKIDRYIEKTATYDYSYKHKNFADILYHGKGTCLAYTELTQIMSLQAGMDTRFCISKNGKHSWNRVKIGNTWYFSDITWNDSENNYSPNSDMYLLSIKLWEDSENHRYGDEFNIYEAYDYYLMR